VLMPTTLKLGSLVFQVEQHDRVPDKEHPEKELYGHINHAGQVIKVATAYGPARAEITLVHEAIHAVDDFFMLELSERQVECLAKGLCMMARDSGMV